MRGPSTKRASISLLQLGICLIALVCVWASPSAAFARYNQVGSASFDDISTDKEPITATEIPDGTYSIDAQSSSSWCVVSECTLVVVANSMEVHCKIGTAYTAIYMGTAAEAAAKTDSSGTQVSQDYILEDKDSKHHFVLPIGSLNTIIQIASYAPSSGWWDRNVIFESSGEIDVLVASGASDKSSSSSSSQSQSTSSSSSEIDTGTSSSDKASLSSLSTSTSSHVKKHTVRFVSNGGSSVASQKVADNAKASYPKTPTRFGYSFVDWYRDKKLENAYDFDTAVTKDITLYAKWSRTDAAQASDSAKSSTTTGAAQISDASGASSNTSSSGSTEGTKPSAGGTDSSSWTATGIALSFADLPLELVYGDEPDSDDSLVKPGSSMTVGILVVAFALACLALVCVSVVALRRAQDKPSGCRATRGTG